jgi:cytoskeletal protein CcmA (bactofilin family)
VSFFGNNTRPDLRSSGDGSDRASRASDTRFLGEVNAPDPSDLSTPTFVGDSRMAPNAGPTPPERCTNIIASGARWKGSLKVDDSVRVDGHFSGEIDTKGTVHVAEGAEMDAKVHAAFVVVAGNFKGEIRADQRTELMPRGKVTGEIVTKVLSVHEGATLDGSVQMTSEGAARLNGARGRNGSAEAETERSSRREAAATAE